jgi:hypothetical protein
MRYALYAGLNERQESVDLDEPDDDEATFAAMREVLDRAHADPAGPWALGRIVLWAPNGRIVQVMEPKAGNGA